MAGERERFDVFGFQRSIRDRRDLSSAEKVASMMLSTRADAAGQAFPSVATLAKDCGLSERKTRRVVNALAALGVVKVVRRTARVGDSDSNLYVLPAGGYGTTDPTPCPIDPTPGTTDPTGGAQQTGGVGHSVPPIFPRELPKGTTHVGGAAPADAPTEGDPWGLTPTEPEPPKPLKPRATRQPKPRVKRAASRRVPEDWKPNEKHRELAKAEGKNFERELAKFCDHEFKPPKSDWDAAFRNWLRSEYGRGNGHSESGPRQPACNLSVRDFLPQNGGAQPPGAAQGCATTPEGDHHDRT